MATRRTTVLAIAGVASIALAGCAGNDAAPSHSPSAKPARGGTLTYYSEPQLYVDPQGTYAGRSITNLSRTVYRSWVTFPVSEDVEYSTTTVADLASDTGQSSDGARTWKFTVKDGVTWEDGKPITCEDFKYGASRVFATDVIEGGPQYLLSYLDLPVDASTGLPIYTGPYHSSAEGKAAFDKAITCEGNTISYHFKKPWPDFPLAVAALHMMDPYRQDKDRGRKSRSQIFSNGPYKLEGTWREHKGGTLVRNDNYDPSTDSTKSRNALPDRIVFEIESSEQTTRRLIADQGKDKAAVTGDPIPAEYYSQVTGSVAERSMTVNSPFTDYLALNFRTLTNLKVRQALAASLDVTAWVTAGGGDKAFDEAHDLVNPAVRGYQKDLFPGGSGDPASARQLLESAGVPTPYPISFAYQRGAMSEEQAAALAEGWERAGFGVTVRGLEDEAYFRARNTPAEKPDLIWADWGADWPSAMTVTPLLFDGRVNLTEDSNGLDIGGYRSAAFEALVDEAQRAEDLDSQTKLLQQADQVLADDVAYLPLATAVHSFLHGSDVTGYVITAASIWYPDLGPIGVE